MKDIIVNKYDHFEILLFVAGIVSTFQGILFHGVTLFSWFLLVLVALGLLEKRGGGELNFYDTKVVLIGLVIVTMTITEVITVCLKEYPEWIGRSVKNYILMVAVFVLFFILRENKKYGEIYFKGVMISCVVNYFACFIEYIAYKINGLDLTQKYLNVETRLKDGRPMITGLTTNPGMLVPAILISLCFSKSLLVKVMAIGTAMIINSSTAVICVALFFVLYGFMSLKDKAVKGWNFSKLVLSVAAIGLIVIAAYEPLRNTIVTHYSYLILRIEDSYSSIGEGLNNTSHRAHFRYYWSLPYIYERIDTVKILFGFGKNCSGIPISEFLGQFKGELWIPESDPIATIYDVGIIGFAAFYGLLCKIGTDVWTADKLKGLFVVCVLAGGFFYGFQMTWFLLFELLIWNAVCVNQNINDQKMVLA